MRAATLVHQTRSVVRYAWRGLRQGAAIHSLSVVIMALCLTALGGAGLVVNQVSRVAAAWNRERVVTVFLAPDIPRAQVDALMVHARSSPHVLDVRFVGDAEARMRLQAALGERADLLAHASTQVIPQAVEAELVPGSPLQAARQLARELGAMKGAEEATFGEQELGRVDAAVGVMRAAALLLAALIALVTILVISNTLKLTVLARKEEVEIMRLVGAGSVFVRAPFVLEGAFLGAVGAMLAGGMVLALHSALAVPLDAMLRSAFGSVTMGDAPWGMVGVLCVLGTVLGVVGGLVGVGRFMRS